MSWLLALAIGMIIGVIVGAVFGTILGWKGRGHICKRDHIATDVEFEEITKE